jgi:hypothetical protein
MSLLGRVARIEKALAADLVIDRGIRNFVTVDDGLTYVETTPERRATTHPMGVAPFDYQLAMLGCGGTLPDDMPRLTAADLDRFNAEGWQCLAIRYVDMQGPVEMDEIDEPEPETS